MQSKWSRGYWADLGERVASTFLGAVLTMLTLDGATSVDWSDEKAVWIVLGAPTVISLVKGLLANMAKTSTTGASALSGLPLNERGAVDNNLLIGLVLGFVLGVIVVLLL